ncbi:hypothetical protein Acr_00g0082290 [Actinidia rufa]|uniref:EVE domain-containing protein n=1 Tax=Actinidia rufa TaxID=165716 RepID=A0A7J0DUK8_9ERIC|nr:hypothetical protein Acr_00g0082290 [Actinidia rufa]
MVREKHCLAAEDRGTGVVLGGPSGQRRAIEGPKARCVVGVVSVVREWYSDGEDGGGAVDVRAVGEMRRPVDLKEMKGDVGLKGFALFRQPRLSVVPVPEDVWDRVCDLGGGFGEDGGGSRGEAEV